MEFHLVFIPAFLYYPFCIPFVLSNILACYGPLPCGVIQSFIQKVWAIY